jgi:hypothetical protein
MSNLNIYNIFNNKIIKNNIFYHNKINLNNKNKNKLLIVKINNK